MYLDRIGLTICAIATAKGGAIGIIRVSGFLAFEIAEKLTGISTFEHQKARLAKIKKEGGTADQCLILPFKAPKSFTGEDLVEFQLHGSSGNADEILQMIVKNGANLALRGEFSFRAVMNSKMTLNESIALNTLITSENPFAIELSRKAAFENRSIAKISALLPEWDYLYALSTATMDFPEQISENLDSNKLLDLISRTGADVSSIFKNSQALEKILNYTAVILGRPNVGKSSLFNILINQNRAIVSDIPGTTRDYISETFFIKGFQVNLIDSAGIRTSDLEIEKIGIEKSKNLIEKGDLLILLFDGSKALSREDEDLLRETSKKSRILVKNKVDCENGDFVFSKRQNENLLEISCKTNSGIEVLKDEIYRQILKNVPDKNEALFFTYWQKAKAQKILSDLSNFKLYVYSDQIELIAFFIKNIFFDLKELAGEPTTQEVYDKIFSSFCLGK